MKTRYKVIIISICTVSGFFLIPANITSLYCNSVDNFPNCPRIYGIDLVSRSAKVWDIDAAQLANETASKYGIFSQQTTWNIHVSSNGKIYGLDGNHRKYDYLNFTCLFSIIPNDDKEHFAYLSVFRSNSTGYVVVLDEYTLSVIDAKPIPYEDAACGP